MSIFLRGHHPVSKIGDMGCREEGDALKSLQRARACAHGGLMWHHPQPGWFRREPTCKGCLQTTHAPQDICAQTLPHRCTHIREGAEDMIKCPPHKRADLSSVPKAHIEKAGVAVHVRSPFVGEEEMRESLSSGQPS